ncbi:MAG: S8/S53 family peptidase [Kineosporiaceae bacterium]|nr:S8/S53 family peptidase [Kineosporiaceae bacterium]
MSGHQIRPGDYSYSPDQQVIADAERERLGAQLTALSHRDRFTLERNADRRLARAGWFDFARGRHLAEHHAYVKDERLVHVLDRGTTEWSLETAESADDTFYRRERTGAVQTAPIHVVAEGSVIKGDSSPERTDRRFTHSSAIVADIAEQPPARIAVIDTGLAKEKRSDAWLAEVPRTDANRDELDGADDTPHRLDLGAGHGTFVAGVVQQVCPSAQITMYKALDSDGVGREDELATTLLQAAADGHEIMTLSLGTDTADGEPPLALQLAMRRLAAEYPEVLVIAAAGNDGNDTEMWPAAFKNVVAVAALTAELQPTEWSSRGDWVSCSTVGEGIVSTFVDGTETAAAGGSVFGPSSWAMWSGTSFAAPQIAGAVARLLQANRDAAWTPRQAYEALLAAAPALPGFGRVIRLLPGTARPAGFRFPVTTAAPAPVQT